MQKTKKISKHYQKAKYVLENYPLSRDNYNEFVCQFWKIELRERGSGENGTINEFFRLLSKGELSNPDSICRARRKVQEENDGLRGESYDVRKDVLEPEVRYEMVNKFGQSSMF